jgi:hypothetical protein|tara:strand:+ start:56 stop:265 length:210 start_codon:yes stop_codon:yes gene_type:complete
MELTSTGMPKSILKKTIEHNGKELARLEKIYQQRLIQFPNDKLYTTLLKKCQISLLEKRENWEKLKTEN